MHFIKKLEYFDDTLSIYSIRYYDELKETILEPDESYLYVSRLKDGKIRTLIKIKNMALREYKNISISGKILTCLVLGKNEQLYMSKTYSYQYRPCDELHTIRGVTIPNTDNNRGHKIWSLEKVLNED